MINAIDLMYQTFSGEDSLSLRGLGFLAIFHWILIVFACGLSRTTKKKVLLVTGLGSFLAMESVDMGPTTRKLVNNLVFFVFNPALVGSNLASTVILETIKIMNPSVGTNQEERKLIISRNRQMVVETSYSNNSNHQCDISRNQHSVPAETKVVSRNKIPMAAVAAELSFS
ncbi:Auxin efflux carrier [Artemisia annua]|uniref:Auxin efflux carrier n=1 Tax=Artemisia annua TaxID=35608 RepID=A0A2U1ME04_ARTAN|nr:Auxin efflux carrier [Artemisia annua]